MNNGLLCVLGLGELCSKIRPLRYAPTIGHYPQNYGGIIHQA